MSTQRTAVITITPDDQKKQLDLQTGAVGTLEIMNHLKALSGVLAKQLCAEYKELTGNDADKDPKGFDAWVKFLGENKF